MPMFLQYLATESLYEGRFVIKATAANALEIQAYHFILRSKVRSKCCQRSRLPVLASAVDCKI